MILASLLVASISAGFAATRAHQGEDPGPAVMFAVMGTLAFLGTIVENTGEAVARAVRERK